MCDIAFFRALATCVAKRRRGLERGKTQFDLERLADDVQAAFKAYSHDTLDQMWAYKSELMKKIVEADGGNWRMTSAVAARPLGRGGRRGSARHVQTLGMQE